MAGFRTTGVCPLDRNIVKSKTLQNPAEVFDPSELPKETGIKFLPLYSPLVGSRQKMYEHKEEKGTLKEKELFEHKEQECDIQKSVTCIQKLKKGISQHGEQDLEFTNAEVTLYEHRFQEGYDLHHDERYNEWIRRFHPSSISPRPPSFSTLDSSLRKLDDADDDDDDDWSRIAQTSLPLDSVDASDVHCLTKASLVDKLVQNRKEQFKLPSLKVKKSSSILTSQENLKLLREKEMKKKKEEEKAKRLTLRQEKKKKKEEEEKVKRFAL